MAPSKLPWDPGDQGAIPLIPHLKKNSQRSPSKIFFEKNLSREAFEYRDHFATRFPIQKTLSSAIRMLRKISGFEPRPPAL